MGRTAGPSTALRFGRDDKFVGPKAPYPKRVCEKVPLSEGLRDGLTVDAKGLFGLRSGSVLAAMMQIIATAEPFSWATKISREEPNRYAGCNQVDNKAGAMELGLGGSVAVVTGGASGIGLACARGLAAEGCRVAVWDRSAAEVDGALGLCVDVGDFGAVQEAVRQTEAALGPIAHLVHAAAIGSGKFGYPFSNLEPADWPRVLQVNILGMVHVAQAIAPGMVARKAGTLVFLASVAGQIGSQTDPPYSASKAANINFAQCLAKDLAPHGIRVNTVSPGMVRTPLNQRVWQAWNEQQPPAKQRSYADWADEKVRAVAPLARWQEPEDVANMVTFLCSARAAQVTGQTINVDGGQVMHS